MLSVKQDPTLLTHTHTYTHTHIRTNIHLRYAQYNILESVDRSILRINIDGSFFIRNYFLVISEPLYGRGGLTSNPYIKSEKKKNIVN